MIYRLILTLFLILVVSCGRTAIPEETSEFQKLMNEDPCHSTNRDRCEYEIVDSITPNLDQRGEAILLIDAGLQLPVVGVHRNRIIAQYEELLKFPYYREIKPVITLPKTMNAILKKLAESPQKASDRRNFAVGKAFEKKYLPLLSGLSTLGHGASTLNALAELNPDSPLIVIHLATENDPIVCKLGETNGIASITRHFKEKAEALRNIAEKHRIKWTNLSFGYDVRSIMEAWHSAKCEGALPDPQKLREYVRIASLFIDELATIPELTIFQATPYSEYPLDKNSADDFPVDCKTIPNRVRVGYLSTPGYELTGRDQRDLRLLDDTERKIAYCGDLFVRDGRNDFSDTEFPLLFSTIGFGHSEMNISGSSFTTPLGLSYAHFLVKSSRVSRDKLLPWIRGGENQPLLISPYATKSFQNQNHTEYLNWYSRKDVP